MGGGNTCSNHKLLPWSRPLRGGAYDSNRYSPPDGSTPREELKIRTGIPPLMGLLQREELRTGIPPLMGLPLREKLMIRTGTGPPDGYISNDRSTGISPLMGLLQREELRTGTGPPDGYISNTR